VVPGRPEDGLTSDRTAPRPRPWEPLAAALWRRADDLQTALDARAPIVPGLVGRVRRHDVGGIAAGLAYRFFLALFPFAIFLTALGAFVARALGITDPTGEVLRVFGSTLPAEVAAIVDDELRSLVERPDAGLLSFGAVAALWIATGGTSAFLKALHRVYGPERGRPFWRQYALALGLTLAGGWLILGLFVLFVGLQVGGGRIATSLGLEPVWEALLVLRWLLAVPVLVAVAGTLYRIGTPARPPWRGVLAGAAVFAVVWLAVTWLFALYVDILGSYGATYGTLAGVAGLLVWLYTSGFVLLLGAEITGWWFDRARGRGAGHVPG
jgi:membrane protein